MQSKTRIKRDDISKMLSVYFGFEVDVYHMEIDNLGDAINVEWEKIEQ